MLDRPLTDWEKETYKKTTEAMEILIDASNTMGSDEIIAEAMYDTFIKRHRTLQQATVRNIVNMLRRWVKGDKDMHVDARNENAWAFGRQVEAWDPYFPYI